VIFIDANIVLRALTQPTDDTSRGFQMAAANLMRRAEQGELQITTSDAVLAEVAFVLTSKNQYNIPSATAAAMIAAVVRLRGFRHPERQILLRALELWQDHPRIEFVDALTASYAINSGMLLATFDAHFDRFPQIARWVPPDFD
jgi:predicted nucleic acid-binding protein